MGKRSALEFASRGLLFVALVAALLVVAATAWAQAAGAGAAEVDVKELVQAADKMIHMPRGASTGWWFFGVIFLCWGVTKLSKLGRVGRWVEAKGWTWTRPLVSALTGFVAGAVGAVTCGVSFGLAVFVGLVCGAAAVGGDQTRDAILMAIEEIAPIAGKWGVLLRLVGKLLLAKPAAPSSGPADGSSASGSASSATASSGSSSAPPPPGVKPPPA